MNANYNIRHFIAHLQLILFCLIQANGILFTHAHKLPNGQIIVHAHPFFPQEDGKPKAHKHTNGELIILGQAFHPAFISQESFSFDFFNASKIQTEEVEKTINHYSDKYHFFASHRGPPVEISFI